MVYDSHRGREVFSGFLIVVRFNVLYETYAPRYENRRDCYAIPRVDRSWFESPIKYRGLDRDALDANDVAPDAMVDLFLADLEKTNCCTDGIISSRDDVDAVLSWLGNDVSRYEIIWAREVGVPDPPPVGSQRLGVDPSYFIGDHFSASCDCMMFPRWHGTDPDGVLFLDHFRRLNRHGLFDATEDAKSFLDYYTSFDWTENDASDYVLVEVFGRDDQTEQWPMVRRGC